MIFKIIKSKNLQKLKINNKKSFKQFFATFMNTIYYKFTNIPKNLIFTNICEFDPPRIQQSPEMFQ